MQHKLPPSGEQRRIGTAELGAAQLCHKALQPAASIISTGAGVREHHEALFALAALRSQVHRDHSKLSPFRCEGIHSSKASDCNRGQKWPQENSSDLSDEQELHWAGKHKIGVRGEGREMG